ncbi:MAG: glucose-6-phosphate dehydrogenase [Firmicutes bacterium]|nr:glucose-6-phosphate dehydrogenase [Bacillota bacterium]
MPMNQPRDGERRHLQPFTMVIFGASGDLTERKLMPALYHLSALGHLPVDFAVIGVARRDWTDDYLREKMRQAIEQAAGPDGIDEKVWADFARRLYYLRGDATDESTFARLEEAIARISAGFPGEIGKNRLYYLATLPSLYPKLIQGLGRLERARSNKGWGRIIVEKPFGSDLESAIELNRLLARYFDESQVFRIDHYLGKETVQNILVFRFANGIFEPIWNRNYIDNVQITVSETVGVGHRGAYYEEAGALRDMVQNHLLQLLALVAMEPPHSFNADAVRNEKVKVLASIPVPDVTTVAHTTVRGQYTAGVVDGKPVPGYLEEPNVSHDSKTETYVALRLGIDNWRWAGVPFYIQTGKRLASRSSRITIYFKRAPHLLFQPFSVPDLQPNSLILDIQPEQGVTLSIGAKVPGPQVRIRNVDMEFVYERSFTERSPEAYEYLLLEAIAGDTTMFTRDDEIEAAWRLVTAIRRAWDEAGVPLHPYPAGSTGPEAKHALLSEGQAWCGG